MQVLLPPVDHHKEVTSWQLFANYITRPTVAAKRNSPHKNPCGRVVVKQVF